MNSCVSNLWRGADVAALSKGWLGTIGALLAKGFCGSGVCAWGPGSTFAEIHWQPEQALVMEELIQGVALKCKKQVNI